MRVHTGRMQKKPKISRMPFLHSHTRSPPQPRHENLLHKRLPKCQASEGRDIETTVLPSGLFLLHRGGKKESGGKEKNEDRVRYIVGTASTRQLRRSRDQDHT